MDMDKKKLARMGVMGISGRLPKKVNKNKKPLAIFFADSRRIHPQFQSNRNIGY
jgi:hypothetical protein